MWFDLRPTSIGNINKNHRQSQEFLFGGRLIEQTITQKKKTFIYT